MHEKGISAGLGSAVFYFIAIISLNL